MKFYLYTYASGEDAVLSDNFVARVPAGSREKFRPAVVIDPADEEAVRRLYDALLDQGADDLSLSPNRVTLALYDFADENGAA